MARPRKERPPLRQRGDVWYATVYFNGREIERSTGQRDQAAAASVAAGWKQEAEAQSRPATPSTGAPLNDVLSELLDDVRAKIRSGDRSADTLDFYEHKAGSLLAFYGHEYSVSAWTRDSTESWNYIRWRRSSKVADASIKKELGTLRTALYLAQEQGLFAGNPSLAIPASFSPGAKPADRVADAGGVPRACAAPACGRGGGHGLHPRHVERASRAEASQAHGPAGQDERPVHGARAREQDGHAQSQRANLPTLYEVRGERKTLSDWARATSIAKNTLWSRLAAGATMAEAIGASAGKLPGNSGRSKPRVAAPAEDEIEPNYRENSVRRGGIEPPTRGFSVPCSTD
jgi:hypothetical protein